MRAVCLPLVIVVFPDHTHLLCFICLFCTLCILYFNRVRKKGEHLIHSKHILLLVVLLNLIDCLLVLGELMLDIKYVTGIYM